MVTGNPLLLTGSGLMRCACGGKLSSSVSSTERKGSSLKRGRQGFSFVSRNTKDPVSRQQCFASCIANVGVCFTRATGLFPKLSESENRSLSCLCNKTSGPQLRIVLITKLTGTKLAQTSSILNLAVRSKVGVHTSFYGWLLVVECDSRARHFAQ